VIVAEAIEALCDLSIDVKWVNDLFINQKKIAGILTEGEFLSNGDLSFAVIGIGLNRTPASLPKEVAPIAASLGSFGKPPEAAPLLAEIINRFYRDLSRLFDASFLGEYRRRSFLLGKRVRTVIGEKEVEGIARGIDENGALILDTPSGVLCLQAGEVSVKL
jgi:BirA family biotin operon repressor/biotin-[acetyl-CoA-carboxylase] ligase